MFRGFAIGAFITIIGSSILFNFETSMYEGT